MSKVFGLTERYKPLRRESTRIVVRYGIEQYDENNSTWYEVYFNKIDHPFITFDDIKSAIISDINAQTDEKILSGFVWNDKPVWLSDENQRNFSEAQRVAVMTEGASLPMKFKLGEDENGNPVYHTFTKVSTLNQFYLAVVAYIQQCLEEGWQRKDSIDWSVYDELNPKKEETE